MLAASGVGAHLADSQLVISAVQTLFPDGVNSALRAEGPRAAHVPLMSWEGIQREAARR